MPSPKQPRFVALPVWGGAQPFVYVCRFAVTRILPIGDGARCDVTIPSGDIAVDMTAEDTIAALGF